MTVIEYLDHKGLEYTVKHRAKGDQAVMNCPFCDDTERKFEINIAEGTEKYGLWRCFHQNSCNRQGTFWSLRQGLGDAPTPENAGDLKSARKAYTRPVVQGAKTLKSSKQWWNWFQQRRGLSEKTLNRFKIAINRDGHVAFPFYKDKELVNVKYRGPDKKFYQEPNAEQTLFGRDVILKSLEDLVIVEGEIDAMSMWEYEIPAVSVPSGASNLDWIENEWDFLSRFKQIFLCFDMDKAGEEAVEKIRDRLGWTWALRRPRLPFKDANECLIQGVTKAEMTDFVLGKGAEELKPSELISLRELRERNQEFTEEHGVPISIRGLQDKLDGWRLGEMTIIGGADGSGKTTFTLQSASDLLRRDQPVCIGSFEMKPKKLVHDLMKQSGFLVLDDFVEAYGTQLFFIDILGEITEKRLLELMEYAAHRFGCQFFVVDSIGRIQPEPRKGLDYYQRQKETANQILTFSKDKNVHTFLVNHARKFENGRHKMTKDDLEGSGWMKNLADNVLLIERIRSKPKDPDEPKIDERITVAKNRYNGREGSIDFLFDPARISYTEVRK